MYEISRTSSIPEESVGAEGYAGDGYNDNESNEADHHPPFHPRLVRHQVHVPLNLQHSELWTPKNQFKVKYFSNMFAFLHFLKYISIFEILAMLENNTVLKNEF